MFAKIRRHDGSHILFFFIQKDLEPVDLAKIKAEERYKRRKTHSSMIFSDQPPLFEVIGE